MDDEETGEFLYGTFPKGFAWSTATASYQVEGGYDEDGKSASIWDTFVRKPGVIQNGDTGDVACDSYHQSKKDVAILKDLGVSHYRFSLAWTRILPDNDGKVNQAGVAFYDNFIDDLLEAGIQPVVTLYHWDLPQTLQDKNGWMNPEIVKHFTDYARTCFKLFGNKVKWWITINEPSAAAWEGYGSGIMAPGVKNPYAGVLHVIHHMLLAHAHTYRLYQDEFLSSQKGQIGITLNADWNEPKDNTSPKDIEASVILQNLKLGWFANPIYGSGDYPAELKQVLSQFMSQFGVDIPEFSPDEQKIVKGSADFMGLNNYTTRIVSKGDEEEAAMNPEQAAALDSDSVGKLFGISEETRPTWKRGTSYWLYHVPWGLRKLLNWIRLEYNNPAVFITENGTSCDEGQPDDNDRVEYLRFYINQMLKALTVDKCNVIGYTVWSLLDNFEWDRGYSERFGLYRVDFDDPKRPRTPKKSAAFYKQLIANNGFKPT